MYTYNANIISVYDGDTVRADIDLGFGIHTHNVDLRLYGINTPELRGDTKELGIAARDVLRVMIFKRDVIMTTRKDAQEKYGRYLAEIVCDGVNVNQWMVDHGYAVRYMAALRAV